MNEVHTKLPKLLHFTTVLVFPLYNFHFLFRLTRSDPMVEIRVPYFVYDSFLKAFFEVNVSILLEIVLGKAAVGKKTWRPCFSTNIN